MKLDLKTEQLRDISEQLGHKIKAGLEQDGQELACLPTFLGLPSGEQSGTTLVVDTGGTNMRAALVSLSPRDGKIEKGPITDLVPDGRDGPAIDGKVFFEAQAKLCSSLKIEESLPLGYCFSYPAANDAKGDATLVRWTKGINVNNVVGHKVGAALQESLKSLGIQTTGVRVLNDTVASLLGGVHLNASARFANNYIGLILGTGTNMAAYFSASQLSKVEGSDSMVVNLESGNFDPPHLSDVDIELDQESQAPGTQRFEKAISGHYLPFLFDKLHPNVINPRDGTLKLVELREQDKGEHGRTAALLLRRSAQMTAAALVAVAKFYDNSNDVAVMGEGSLLWGDPLYVPCLRETLATLYPERKIELVKQRENVNLLGAASAALD